MFGLIVAGRLVQTDVNQLSETEFLFNVPDADNINHVVFFMTGQVPFPNELGGAGNCPLNMQYTSGSSDACQVVLQLQVTSTRHQRMRTDIDKYRMKNT